MKKVDPVTKKEPKRLGFMKGEIEVPDEISTAWTKSELQPRSPK